MSTQVKERRNPGEVNSTFWIAGREPNSHFPQIILLVPIFFVVFEAPVSFTRVGPSSLANLVVLKPLHLLCLKKRCFLYI